MLLIGALALQCYGFRDRLTNDVDGELAGPLHPFVPFLALGKRRETLGGGENFLKKG